MDLQNDVLDYLKNNCNGKLEINLSKRVLKEHQAKLEGLYELADKKIIGKFEFFHPHNIVCFYIKETPENSFVSYVIKMPILKTGKKEGEKNPKTIFYTDAETERSKRIFAFFKKWCLRKHIDDSSEKETMTLYSFAQLKKIFVVSFPVFLSSSFFQEAKEADIVFNQISPLIHFQICDFCEERIDVSFVESDIAECPYCHQQIVIRKCETLNTNQN